VLEKVPDGYLPFEAELGEIVGCGTLKVELAILGQPKDEYRRERLGDTAEAEDIVGCERLLSIAVTQDDDVFRS
jgi:hypothetical protein